MILSLEDCLTEATSNCGRSEDWANAAHPLIANRISPAALAGLLEMRSETQDWPNNLAMRPANDPLFAAMAESYHYALAPTTSAE